MVYPGWCTGRCREGCTPDRVPGVHQAALLILLDQQEQSGQSYPGVHQEEQEQSGQSYPRVHQEEQEQSGQSYPGGAGGRSSLGRVTQVVQGGAVYTGQVTQVQGGAVYTGQGSPGLPGRAGVLWQGSRRRCTSRSRDRERRLRVGTSFIGKPTVTLLYVTVLTTVSRCKSPTREDSTTRVPSGVHAGRRGSRTDWWNPDR